jgi:hypothetical protein
MDKTHAITWHLAVDADIPHCQDQDTQADKILV